MIGVKAEFRPVRLLRPEPVEALNGRMAVRAVDPLAGRAPLELGGLGGLGQRFAGAEKGFDIDAVVNCCRRYVHFDCSSVAV